MWSLVHGGRRATDYGVIYEPPTKAPTPAINQPQVSQGLPSLQEEEQQRREDTLVLTASTVVRSNREAPNLPLGKRCEISFSTSRLLPKGRRRERSTGSKKQSRSRSNAKRNRAA